METLLFPGSPLTAVANPLLELWQMVHGHGADYRSDARRPPAPDHDLTPLDRDSVAADLQEEPEVVEMFDWPRRPTRWHLSLAIRELSCRRYAWAVPCTEALTALRRLSPLVEIGAGTGYWASLLGGHGADVAAYDLAPPRPPPGAADPRSIAEVLHTDPAQFFPVTQATGVDAAQAHADRALLLGWPPWAGSDRDNAGDAASAEQDPHGTGEQDQGDPGFEIVRAYRRAGGRIVAYVGEGEGGHTGGWQLHHELAGHWGRVEEVAIPQWAGFPDSLMVYNLKR